MTRAIVFLLALVFMQAAAFAQTPVTWEDLIDPETANFDDPYKALSGLELRSLGTVLRLRQRLSEEDIAAEARPRIESRLAQEEAKLAASGVQTEWLLSQRHSVAKKRAKAALTGNPALDGQEVAITGYAIPVDEPGEDGTASGYLVPEQGMCSHMPAPNPNQMIRYTIEAGNQASYVYEPVLLTGRLTLKTTRQEIVLLDGYVDMLAAFDLQVTGIRGLEDETPDNPASRLWKYFKRGETVKPEAAQ
ncbi:DUF3299 domain-containing protein [Roseibium aggregatum]|uniref:DUF3299 domain-containing protein n=1 Tax=Roseibium aggregatum TaxID=187304 RepID=A0A939EJ15_9HYPH|nr:DUF3299 domain-containing protein [Roseibium aggregatum]MBN9673297.1 DUF3299 domain-containing protein [Roseibium aggregatum]